MNWNSELGHSLTYGADSAVCTSGGTSHSNEQGIVKLLAVGGVSDAFMWGDDPMFDKAVEELKRAGGNKIKVSCI